MSDSATRRQGGFIRITALGFRFVFRRWPEMLAVILSMLLGIGLSVLQPWPMKLLVDNVLGGKPLPHGIANLPLMPLGAFSRQALHAWSVTATVILFSMNRAVGLFGA